MPQRIYASQEDEALRRAQALDDARPSHAARFLTAIADKLSDQRISRQTLTGERWMHASAAAARRVLQPLCQHTASDAVVVALTTCPEIRPSETCGEYALRLRAAARSL